MKNKDSITHRVNRNGHSDLPETPLLSLSEFFDANDVTGSICCNLNPYPEPNQVLATLLKIENHENVDAVYVQDTAFEDPDWPFSDTVWVVTSATIQEERSWIPNELSPDEVWEGWIESQSYESITIPTDMQPIAICWD